jgi:glycosyltransferase involved in cell wall biosynthesis
MADVPLTPNSGASGTEYQTIRALERLGNEVDALWEYNFPHKIKHGNLHYLLELPTAYRKAMQSRLSKQRYDVVHVNQPHGYLAAKALRRAKQSPAFIHRSHGLEMRAEVDLTPWHNKYRQDRRSLPKKFLSRIIGQSLLHNFRSIARYADGHIVSASQCRQFLCEQLGVPPKRIALIPQAAADFFLHNPSPGMTEHRLRRVLHVGQFAFFKAPMIVAEVMNRLSSGVDNVELTWVCSKKHHPQIREMLDERTRERVSLLDWMTQDELMQVYDQHGLFLFPSFFEGFGKVFVEAMSRGLCVVAGDNSGAHDVITHEVDGLLVPTGDIDATTKNCLRLINNPNLAIELSRAASETAGHYTWDRVGRETVAFYEDRIAAKAKELAAGL